jgi:hypothetical protein
MSIIHVPLLELLCQTMMGLIPALERLLPDTRGRLWPRLIVLGIKCRCFPRLRRR